MHPLDLLALVTRKDESAAAVPDAAKARTEAEATAAARAKVTDVLAVERTHRRTLTSRA